MCLWSTKLSYALLDRIERINNCIRVLWLRPAEVQSCLNLSLKTEMTSDSPQKIIENAVYIIYCSL